MVPVKTGEIYSVKISSVSSDGNGAAHISSFAVFVPNTVPGDYAQIKIESVKNRYATASLYKIITPSPHRRTAPCTVCGECGGCPFQCMDYARQLEEKRSIAENAMRRLGGFSDFAFDEIIGSGNEFYYRNKVIFQTGYTGDSKKAMGFFKRKSHEVVPADKCMLISREMNKIAEFINKNSDGISFYDERTKQGELKSVFLRSTQSGDIMVALSANKKISDEVFELFSKLKRFENVKSAYANVYKNSSFPECRHIFGDTHLEEEILGVRFDISPQSFFQVNHAQAKRLYKKALELADISEGDTVMDIYCGTGTISLAAAKYAGAVVGIEAVDAAIADAKKNAEKNGISNAEFFAGRAEEVVPRLVDEGFSPDTVILDPPRAGSDTQTLDAIVRANPKRIVYVSCNPATLARDIKYLHAHGFSPTASAAVDMFPQTAHVECVVAMNRDRK